MKIFLMNSYRYIEKLPFGTISFMKFRASVKVPTVPISQNSIGRNCAKFRRCHLEISRKIFAKCEIKISRKFRWPSYFGEVKDLGYYGLLIKIVLAIDKMPPDLVALGTLVVHSRGGNRNLVFRLPRKGAIR